VSYNKTDESNPLLATMLRGEIHIPAQHHSKAVADLDISVRLKNVLADLNIIHLGQLDALPMSKIKAQRNCGKKTIFELAAFIDSVGSLTVYPEEGIEHSAIDFYIPESVRGRPILDLPISRRLANVLDKAGVKCLGDLHLRSAKSLSVDKGLGRTTLNELFQLVASLQRGRLEYIPQTPEQSIRFLVNFLDTEIANLPLKWRYILLDRLSESVTLEAAGRKHGLSRERIRQIEGKALGCLLREGGPRLVDALQSIEEWQSQDFIVITSGLISISAGGGPMLHEADVYLRGIFRMRPSLVIWPEDSYFRGNKPEELRSILSDLEKLLRKTQTPIDAKQAFIEVSSGTNVSPQSFIRSLLGQKHMAITFPSPGRLLVHPPRLSNRDMIIRILEESHRPLTAEEIISQSESRFGPYAIKSSARAITNGLSRSTGIFYLLGPRRFGLVKHFSIKPEGWGQIRDDFVELLIKERRPISAHEVISRRLFDWSPQINAHELAEILRPDRRISDLGRLLFASISWGLKEREKVKDLVPAILARTGRPMTPRELTAAVRQRRSIATTLMNAFLRSIPGVRELGFGYFGLDKWPTPPPQLFISKRSLVARIISRAEPPFRFFELASAFGISETDDAFDLLWKIVMNLPRIKIIFSEPRAHSLLVHDSWPLHRFVRAVLEEAGCPLKLFDIQWRLNDRFGESFRGVTTAQLRKSIEESPEIVKAADGALLLDRHLEESGLDLKGIASECESMLKRSAETASCHDLLERLNEESILAEGLTASILAAILREHSKLEEVAKNIFRSKP